MVTLLEALDELGAPGIVRRVNEDRQVIVAEWGTHVKLRSAEHADAIAGFEVGARLKLEVSQGSIHLTIEQPPKPALPKVRKMGRLQLARLHQTP